MFTFGLIVGIAVGVAATIFLPKLWVRITGKAKMLAAEVKDKL